VLNPSQVSTKHPPGSPSDGTHFAPAPQFCSAMLHVLHGLKLQSSAVSFADEPTLLELPAVPSPDPVPLPESPQAITSANDHTRLSNQPMQQA